MDCRILVVDDDKTVRTSIAEYLNNLKYPTDMAENARMAMARMKTTRYDIVVMEINMPRYSDVYSGRFLLYHIHNRHPSIRVIVVTGDASIETGLEAMRLGASSWMTKPFSLDTLEVKIKELLRYKNIHAFPNRRKTNELNY